VNRILSRAVKVAGSLAIAGGALVAAAMPAGAAPPTQAWGVSAGGFIHINPVAEATFFNTPAVSAAFVYPGFINTGGIMDRASGTQAYSQVGSPKVYLFSQVDQLNADMASSTCRIGFFGTAGDTTIQNGSINVTGLPSIPLPRNPGINQHIFLPGITVTLNRQTMSGGIRTVTAIYLNGFGQNLSIGTSRC
jgi:ABC-type glycerol-3-phosphate transport system substrate-binding protein